MMMMMMLMMMMMMMTMEMIIAKLKKGKYGSPKKIHEMSIKASTTAQTDPKPQPKQRTTAPSIVAATIPNFASELTGETSAFNLPGASDDELGLYETCGMQSDVGATAAAARAWCLPTWACITSVST